MSTVKVAVTQHEPIYFDLEASINKTCLLIEEAAAAGAKLIAFPECWTSGYPAWIWARPVDPPLATSYITNSLTIPSSHLARLQAAARKNSIAILLGASENANSTLYISQLTISPIGTLLMHRRKLRPTHMERTLFGDASGGSLHNVVDVPGVGRVSALACWEHALPLLKYHTLSQHPQIHVAAWPPVHAFDGSTAGGGGLYSMSADGCMALSQAFAMEAGVYVLHVSAVMSGVGITAHGTEGNMLFGRVGGGCSAVFGPDGRRLSEALATDKEGMVYAELDLGALVGVKHFLDNVGHYSRPDLLWLGVDDSERVCVRGEGGEK